MGQGLDLSEAKRAGLLKVLRARRPRALESTIRRLTPTSAHFCSHKRHLGDSHCGSSRDYETFGGLGEMEVHDGFRDTGLYMSNCANGTE